MRTPTSRRCGPAPKASPGTHAHLIEAWQRYGTAVALTEVHLGCTREEQMRWLLEAWDGAHARARAGRRRARGHRVGAARLLRLGLAGHARRAAITSRAPSTCDAPTPRPTALARSSRSWRAAQRPRHPALDGRPLVAASGTAD